MATKTGRPDAEIDQEQFEKLCHIQCTESEICSVLGVTDKTLMRWCKRTYKKPFSEIYREKKEGGKTSLRRAQWLTAVEGGNATMQIWLGKNILGQKDKVEHEAGGKAAELLQSLVDLKAGTAAIREGPAEE